jgi:glutamate decarboxylase
MEPEADRLMAECLDKNMIDKDEYPQTAELEVRCVNMLARLWNAPGNGSQATPALGCSTIGSSEAAMFAGLALKRRWQQRRRAAGPDTARPNLVMGINVQVCWDKFCNYFEVEPRFAPMAGERFHLDAEQTVGLCDENTIGVVAVLGSTFDGSYEPVAEIAAALDGWQVPAYTFPPDREDLAALGVVVRNGTGREMADLLLDDVAHLLPRLQRQAAPGRGPDAGSFDHATAHRKT